MLSHTIPISAFDLLLAPDCANGGFLCSASHLLPWLYAVAAILAVVLVLVVILAVRVWRKNKNEDLGR